MRSNIESEATTPVSEQTIEEVAEYNGHISAEDVRRILNGVQQHIEEHRLIPVITEINHVVGDCKGARILLCERDTRDITGEVAEEIDDEAISNIAGDIAVAAYDRELRNEYSSLFESKQDASEATLAVDGLVVDLPE